MAGRALAASKKMGSPWASKQASKRMQRDHDGLVEIVDSRRGKARIEYHSYSISALPRLRLRHLLPPCTHAHACSWPSHVRAIVGPRRPRRRKKENESFRLKKRHLHAEAACRAKRKSSPEPIREAQSRKGGISYHDLPDSSSVALGVDTPSPMSSQDRICAMPPR